MIVSCCEVGLWLAACSEETGMVFSGETRMWEMERSGLSELVRAGFRGKGWPGFLHKGYDVGSSLWKEAVGTSSVP